MWMTNGGNPDRFLKLLSLDQTKHESTIPLLDRDEPTFYWVFRNCDFIQWNSGKFPVLWLAGPTECRINEVSSYIVRLENDTTLGSQHFVLYFYCSSVVGKRSSVTSFIQTFLHQFICRLPPNNRGAVVIAFLQTLLDRIFRRDPSRFDSEDSSDSGLKKILDAPPRDLWDALKAAFNAEPEQKLSIIIDGLDKIEEPKTEFIKGLREFVEVLLERRWKPKVLLTSRPRADVKEILDGLLYIEYDKERKGSANFSFSSPLS
jgi:hypothetical protein